VLAQRPGSQALVIGYYVDQLERIAEGLGAPLITGRTPRHEREELYDRFRAGALDVLCVSKVANFALDLPNASVAVQVAGTFGSRQEEAQRLGRLLRPKLGDSRAFFYTLVSHDTCEQEYAHKRQRFLAEQGYRYTLTREPPTAQSGQQRNRWARRNTEPEPLLDKPITSELGNVTPVIVVPGDWSRSAFDFHAQERDCRVGGGTRVRCCDA
jgi:superfamily II DNA or RNA helicase